jgi:hypothetical protein
MRLRYICLSAVSAVTLAWSASANEIHFETRDAAMLATSGSPYDRLLVDGHREAGDGGAAEFVRAGSTVTDGASFDDAGGNHWKFVANHFGINVKQFGAYCDWNINNVTSPTYSVFDAAAHDDAGAFNAALDFAAKKHGEDDRGGGGGRIVHVPAASCMLASPIRVLDQVTLQGEGPLSSVLVMKGSFSTSSHFVYLGNANQLASFGSRLEQLQLWSRNMDGASGTAMIYSDNSQHTGGVARIKVFGGNRSALKFELGYGGASYVTIEDFEGYNVGDRDPATGATPTGSVNPIMSLNYADGTFVNARNVVLQGPRASSGAYSSSAEGLRIYGGQIELDGFHTEGVAYGIRVSIPASPAIKGATRLRNLTGGNGCTDLVTIDSIVSSATSVVGMAHGNGCSGYTVSDGHTGSGTTGRVILDTAY